MRCCDATSNDIRSDGQPPELIHVLYDVISSVFSVQNGLLSMSPCWG